MSINTGSLCVRCVDNQSNHCPCDHSGILCLKEAEQAIKERVYTSSVLSLGNVFDQSLTIKLNRLPVSQAHYLVNYCFVFKPTLTDLALSLCSHYAEWKPILMINDVVWYELEGFHLPV